MGGGTVDELVYVRFITIPDLAWEDQPTEDRYPDIAVDSGSTIVEDLPIPKRNGYIFKNWRYWDDSIRDWVELTKETIITRDLTVYGNFVEVVEYVFANRDDYNSRIDELAIKHNYDFSNCIFTFTNGLENEVLNIDAIIEPDSNGIIPIYHSPYMINAEKATHCTGVVDYVGTDVTYRNEDEYILHLSPTLFKGCPNLEVISLLEYPGLHPDFNGCGFDLPEDLFKWCPKLTTFSICNTTGPNYENGRFINMRIGLPDNLFKYNPLLSDLFIAFMGHIIKHIPANLFANNPELTNIQKAFQWTIIDDRIVPDGLFRNNSKLAYITGLFNKSNITYVPFDLFDSCKNALTNAGRVFDSCYYLISKVPDIWNFPNKPRYNYCIYGSYLIENILDAPDDARNCSIIVFENAADFNSRITGILTTTYALAYTALYFKNGLENETIKFPAGYGAPICIIAKKMTDGINLYKGCIMKTSDSSTTRIAHSLYGFPALENATSIFEGNNFENLTRINDNDTFNHLPNLKIADNMFSGCAFDYIQLHNEFLLCNLPNLISVKGLFKDAHSSYSAHVTERIFSNCPNLQYVDEAFSGIKSSILYGKLPELWKRDNIKTHYRFAHESKFDNYADIPDDWK